MSKAVTVINVDDVPEEVALRGRVNDIRRKRFPAETGLQGVNLEFGYTLIPDGYFTPRHRHNFDQIRLTLDGVFSTGHGDLAPGECGYFPEGAYYGPQEQKGNCWCIVFQFQGPTGEHFLSNDEANQTFARLVADGGSFEGGFYSKQKPNGGKINKDSYTAIYEEFVGKTLTIPAARYRVPVMMMSEAFQWIPSRTNPDVDVKHMGTFSEHETSVSFLRMQEGAELPERINEDAEILYVTEGEIEYEGKRWSKGTYFFVPVGARFGQIHSLQQSIFFKIGLPMIRNLMEAPRQERSVPLAHQTSKKAIADTAK